MDFKTIFERSWKLFVTHLAALLLSTLVYLAVSVVSLGIMAPVLTAGYTQSLLLLIRDGRKPEIRDLFGQMRLFFPLLVFMIVCVLTIMIGFGLLVVPGVAVAIGLSFFCLYMLPLMTDQGLGLIEAVKESGRMALDPPIGEHIAIVVVFLVLSSIGNSTGIGVLFTQPFATLFVLLVYELKRRRMLPPPSKNEG
jgi:hypothetical protein